MREVQTVYNYNLLRNFPLQVLSCLNFFPYYFNSFLFSRHQQEIILFWQIILHRYVSFFVLSASFKSVHVKLVYITHLILSSETRLLICSWVFAEAPLKISFTMLLPLLLIQYGCIGAFLYSHNNLHWFIMSHIGSKYL